MTEKKKKNFFTSNIEKIRAWRGAAGFLKICTINPDSRLYEVQIHVCLNCKEEGSSMTVTAKNFYRFNICISSKWERSAVGARATAERFDRLSLAKIYYIDCSGERLLCCSSTQRRRAFARRHVFCLGI
jgi:hypothetical protein